MRRLNVFFFIMIVAFTPLFQTNAKESATSPQVVLLSESDWGKLPVLSEEDFQFVSQRDPEILRGLSRSNVHVLPTSLALEIFARVSDRDLAWGPLRLFADDLFTIKGKSVFISQETLLEIDQRYHLHLLFPIQGKTARDKVVDGKLIPAGTNFVAQFMIAGDGGLQWITYDFPLALHSEEYNVLTSNYEIYAVNRIRVGRDEVGRYAMHALEGRNQTHAKFKAIRGPMNVGLGRLVLAKDQKFVTTYIWPIGHVTVPHLAIQTKPQNNRLQIQVVSQQETRPNRSQVWALP